MARRKGERGSCVHCGDETVYAWVDTRSPRDNIIHVCIECMNKAAVGSYASEAYERVGQATYRQLLKSSRADRA